MKIIGINGSPRKTWNSALVLQEALRGAADAGAETERFDLFDLNYKGCISCFACKRLGEPSFARCAQRDDLTEVLDRILAADAVIISAPIYCGDVPGAVRNLYERLLFPSNLYSTDGTTGYDRKIHVGLIYTMGAPEPEINDNRAEKDRLRFETFVGPVDILNVVETYQFDDYSRYASSMFDVEVKQRHREEQFPEECRNAYEMGRRLAQETISF